jgi:hypothetical protein
MHRTNKIPPVWVRIPDVEDPPLEEWRWRCRGVYSRTGVARGPEIGVAQSPGAAAGLTGSLDSDYLPAASS